MKSFTIGEPANSGFNMTQLEDISSAIWSSELQRQTSRSSSAPCGASRESLDGTCLFQLVSDERFTNQETIVEAVTHISCSLEVTRVELFWYVEKQWKAVPAADQTQSI